MALRGMDGFESYSSLDEIRMSYPQVVDNGSVSFVTGLTSPGNCLRFNSIFSELYIGVPETNTLIVGFHFKIDALPGGNVIFMDTFEYFGTQLSFLLNSSGQVFVQRGFTVLGTSVQTVQANVVCHLEIKTVFNSTTGSIEIRKDGVAILTLTNQNTIDSGQPNCVGFNLKGISNTFTFYDNLFYMDASGLALNNFLGPRRVLTIRPTTIGSFDDLKKSSGTDAVSLVNEQTPSTSDFIFSATPNDKTTFTMDSVNPSSIDAVKINCVLQKDEAGVRSVKLVGQKGVTEKEYDQAFASTNYGNFAAIAEKDVNNTNWTTNNLNTTEFGVKIV